LEGIAEDLSGEAVELKEREAEVRPGPDGSGQVDLWVWHPCPQ